MPRRLLFLLLATSVLASDVFAQDWPQFRGPAGQGHSTERGLPLEWSETQQRRLEDAGAGLGWSSPVVAGGRVWLTTGESERERGVSLRALAFDVATGQGSRQRRGLRV